MSLLPSCQHTACLQDDHIHAGGCALAILKPVPSWRSHSGPDLKLQRPDAAPRPPCIHQHWHPREGKREIITYTTQFGAAFVFTEIKVSSYTKSQLQYRGAFYCVPETSLKEQRGSFTRALNLWIDNDLCVSKEKHRA
jgi:hypothetical protein